MSRTYKADSQTPFFSEISSFHLYSDPGQCLGIEVALLCEAAQANNMLWLFITFFLTECKWM
jgi:hypothetical protein